MHLPHGAGSIGRRETSHSVLSDVHGAQCCDDELHFNTQSSSQWDGLCKPSDNRILLHEVNELTPIP